MTLKPVFIATLAAASMGATLLTAAPAFADELRCGSSPGANNYCNTDTSRGVTLLYQHSSYGCYQNDTWGYDRGGIWVSNGCSATFRVGNTRDRDDDNTAAAVGLGILALGILGAATQDQGDDRQPPPPQSSYPPDPYQQGQGQYQGGYNNQDDDEEDDTLIISCNSKNNRYKLCPVRIQGYVELVRQKSRNACRFNKSWGYDRRGIWVNKGCRAEFAVY
jgi:hypothetical protein